MEDKPFDLGHHLWCFPSVTVVYWMWLIGDGHLTGAESLVSLPETGIRDFRALINFCWSFELKTSSLWSGVVVAFYKLLRVAEKSGLGREQNAGAPRKAERSGHVASVSVRLRPGFLMIPVPSSSPSVTCSISVHGYSRTLQDPCSIYSLCFS